LILRRLFHVSGADSSLMDFDEAGHTWYPIHDKGAYLVFLHCSGMNTPCDPIKEFLVVVGFGGGYTGLRY